ncbi:MAG: DegT/DnrJ/EryC1/StrS family aminotransferase [Elusimicrobia bacterium]|nr:DegT/DnrJ/EryC1/StrS family aminotransferase [Elusimicrobiota bacterium]
MSGKIFVCEPFLSGNEERYVLDALRSGWISSAGRYLTEFENKFSAYCGSKYGISTSNGTTALHLALKAMGVEEGDEVIMPDFTMAAVLFAVLYCRAKPVFVDAEPDTWNIDPKQIEPKITKRTKVIVVVHTYGHPCDMDPILALAKKRKLKVLEDSAEAHGAEYMGRKCGSMGDAAAFSFYANKIIATGEGGMVVTSDDRLAQQAKYYRNLCFPMKGPRDYRHDDVGYNYRFTNIQAAIGLAQLEKIEDAVDRRRAHAAFYNSRLAGLPGLTLPVERPYAKNVYWMYGVVVDEKKAGVDRDGLANRLLERGVETRPFFKPMRRQRPVVERFGASKAKHPVTDRIARQGLYLPSGTGLTNEELTSICGAVQDSLGRG